MVGAVVAGGSEVDGEVVPVMLRQREVDDEMRDGVARTMVRMARSGVARDGVEVRTERLRRRRDAVVDRAVVLLR